MAGFLLNTEDMYTEAANEILDDFNTGKSLTWDVKIQLQGRPAPEAAKIVIEHFNLPITPQEYMALNYSKLDAKWADAQFLPGALELLQQLKASGIPIALGTSSHLLAFKRKTSHLEQFEVFGSHIVTGDDTRIPSGRGKPHPDIWRVCLESLNQDRDEEIKPQECIVFEDGIPGVNAGKAFESFVVWVPDKMALKLLEGGEKDVLGDHEGVILSSLVEFDSTLLN